MSDGADWYQRYLSGDEQGLVEIIRLYKDGLILYLTGIVGDVCRTIYEDVQKGAGSLTLTWKPGGELLQALTEDPSFALPDHTVSFAVDYENGRSEVHTLTIHYADGEGYVHYDGVRER